MSKRNSERLGDAQAANCLSAAPPQKYAEMDASPQMTEAEMWHDLSHRKRKNSDELTADVAHETPEDLDTFKSFVLSERRDDAIEEIVDCYTLGVRVARMVADKLSQVCSPRKGGHFVYCEGWSDERVIESLCGDMALLVEDLREEFNGSPLINQRGGRGQSLGRGGRKL